MTTLRDFVIRKRLGKGAFGEVFKVTRKTDNEIYALKKVSIKSMSQREISDALNEIRFLASIRHPNIVGFLEAFVVESSMELCIVQEFANGGDISHKVERYRRSRRYLDEKLIWSYFLQVTEGLENLHSYKILHRDLKPANCFLTADGRVKIGDLNVSKLAKQGLVKTQIGTPYYMSPEIWHNRAYDEKSDMWALGCILYEMAALRPPFRGRSIDDLARRVQSGYFPRIPSHYSRELETMIATLLRVNPRHRPTAEQVLQMPCVKRRREELRQWMDATLKTHLAMEEDRSLLDTITVPRNVKRNLSAISSALPEPQYTRSSDPPTLREHEDSSTTGTRSDGLSARGREASRANAAASRDPFQPVQHPPPQQLGHMGPFGRDKEKGGFVPQDLFQWPPSPRKDKVPPLKRPERDPPDRSPGSSRSNGAAMGWPAAVRRNRKEGHKGDDGGGLSRHRHQHNDRRGPLLQPIDPAPQQAPSGPGRHPKHRAGRKDPFGPRVAIETALLGSAHPRGKTFPALDSDQLPYRYLVAQTTISCGKTVAWLHRLHLQTLPHVAGSVVAVVVK